MCIHICVFKHNIWVCVSFNKCLILMNELHVGGFWFSRKIKDFRSSQCNWSMWRFACFYFLHLRPICQCTSEIATIERKNDLIEPEFPYNQAVFCLILKIYHPASKGFNEWSE